MARREQRRELGSPRQVGGLDEPLGTGIAHVVERRPHLRRVDAVQLGPGQAVERELEGVGRVGAARLPVDDQVAVAVGVDRVDPPADDLAPEDERERRLDRDRDPVGERAGLEALDQLPEVGVVLDVDVAAAGEVVGVEQQLLPEPGLDPGVEAGPEPGRGRRPTRHRPGQVAGEGLRVVAQPGDRGGRQAGG